MRLFHLKYLLLPLLFLFGGNHPSYALSGVENCESFRVLKEGQRNASTELEVPSLHVASSSKKEKDDERGDLDLLFFEEEDDDKVKRPFKLAPVRYTWADPAKKEKGVVQLLPRLHPPTAFSQPWHLILQVFRN